VAMSKNNVMYFRVLKSLFLINFAIR
jgi:hypothetical protein